jgi:DNA-binding transcriptional LysR family regulator
VDLLQLRYFQAVARREHVSRAAGDLHVAQPSLSRAIARLEAELGVPLFDREGRRVRLNRFGTAFARRVDSALAALDEGRRELHDAAGLDHGTVALAAETLRTLTGLLAGFLAEHPGVRFRLFQSSAQAMLGQLRTGELDLCFASQPLTGPSLETIELASEEVLLAVPSAHPLAGRSRVGIGELADEPFVTTRPGYWQRALADQLFAQAGIRPAIACEGDEPGAIRGLISAGLGVGILPAISRDAVAHPPVAWLHLDAPGAFRTLRLVWRKDSYMSVAARRFRGIAAEHFSQLPADI